MALATQDCVIDVRGLQKNFGKQRAVLDVSLNVLRGEIFGFIGPNGSGKTTTIRMLCGLLTPQSGHGTCLGYNILNQQKEIKKHVGYMAQGFDLYEELTVYENLFFRGRLYGLNNLEARIEEVVQRFNLRKYKNHIAGALSWGWKQRLQLATAFIHQPKLLLLDEPTARVDPKARRDFWQIINELISEGTTVLLSSQNMDEIEYCHRIAYMAYGKILMAGLMNEMISQAGLLTWVVKGPNLLTLMKKLQAMPEIEQVVVFHDSLHVSGQNKMKIEQALNPFFMDIQYQWQHIETSFEEVFLWLSTMTKDTRHE